MRFSLLVAISLCLSSCTRGGRPDDAATQGPIELGATPIPIARFDQLPTSWSVSPSDAGIRLYWVTEGSAVELHELVVGEPLSAGTTIQSQETIFGADAYAPRTDSRAPVEFFMVGLNPQRYAIWFERWSATGGRTRFRECSRGTTPIVGLRSDGATDVALGFECADPACPSGDTVVYRVSDPSIAVERFCLPGIRGNVLFADPDAPRVVSPYSVSGAVQLQVVSYSPDAGVPMETPGPGFRRARGFVPGSGGFLWLSADAGCGADCTDLHLEETRCEDGGCISSDSPLDPFLTDVLEAETTSRGTVVAGWARGPTNLTLRAVLIPSNGASPRTLADATGINPPIQFAESDGALFLFGVNADVPMPAATLMGMRIDAFAE